METKKMPDLTRLQRSELVAISHQRVEAGNSLTQGPSGFYEGQLHARWQGPVRPQNLASTNIWVSQFPVQPSYSSNKSGNIELKIRLRSRWLTLVVAHGSRCGACVFRSRWDFFSVRPVAQPTSTVRQVLHQQRHSNIKDGATVARIHACFSWS
jgi:hypothetical protein